MIRFGFLVVSALMLAACGEREGKDVGGGYDVNYLEKHLDYGEGLHVFGRPCEWKGDRMDLGYHGFTATVGPHFYEDDGDEIADFYSVDVEFDFLEEDGSLVVFSRDLRIDELPEGYEALKVGDVATFDRETLRVLFRIGEHEFVYQIPEPDRG